MRSQYLAVLCCAGALSAQEAVHSTALRAVGADSGWIANGAAAERVVWAHDVVTAGDWVQLRFADSNLPEGTRLRIFGTTRPADVQWHDARSLRDYRGWSCHFMIA